MPTIYAKRDIKQALQLCNAGYAAVAKTTDKQGRPIMVLVTRSTNNHHARQKNVRAVPRRIIQPAGRVNQARPESFLKYSQKCAIPLLPTIGLHSTGP